MKYILLMLILVGCSNSMPVCGGTDESSNAFESSSSNIPPPEIQF